MSTRANVIIQESFNLKTERLYFYRHSDGYPEGTMPTLEIFVKWLKKGVIRNNIHQSAGWLILLGAMEYNSIPKYDNTEDYPDASSIENPKNWKCGAYEITTGIHGDIEFLYLIDLNRETVKTIPPSSWKKYEN